MVWALQRAGFKSDGPISEFRIVKEPFGLLEEPADAEVVGGFEVKQRKVFLQYDTGIDQASIIRARHFSHAFSRRFPDLTVGVVGDISGPKAVLAKILSASGVSILLVPEGLGVFRGMFDDLPWRWIGRRKAVGHRLARALTLAREDWLTRSGSLARALALLRAIAFDIWSLLSHRVPRPDDLQLREVDTVISSWPEAVRIPVAYKRHVFLLENRGDDCACGREPGLALFVHSPVGISRDTWVAVLENLPQGITKGLVKPHRDHLGLPEFLEAIDLLGIPYDVLESDAPFETLDLDRCPEFIVGTTSTVLLDLAFRMENRRILSVAPSLRDQLRAEGDDRFNYLFETGLNALEKFGAERIEFV